MFQRLFAQGMEKVHDFHGIFDRDASFGNSRGFAVTCGTAALLVLDSNPRRKRALFINDSDTAIYLFKGPPVGAAINAGIRLNASGGSWEETPDTLGYLWRGPFSAITSAATKVLAITEEI